MTRAEIRLLRFLQVAGVHQKWVPYSTILNTEDLLPEDEKALQGLLAEELVLKHLTEPAYRLSQKGGRAIAHLSSQP